MTSAFWEELRPVVMQNVPRADCMTISSWLASDKHFGEHANVTFCTPFHHIGSHVVSCGPTVLVTAGLLHCKRTPPSWYSWGKTLRWHEYPIFLQPRALTFTDDPYPNQLFYLWLSGGGFLFPFCIFFFFFFLQGGSFLILSVISSKFISWHLRNTFFPLLLFCITMDTLFLI